MTDPLADLAAERERLNRKLDEAVARYAEFEQDLNARMKLAGPDELTELMVERARIEDALGITDLVERIDALRSCMAILHGQEPQVLAG